MAPEDPDKKVPFAGRWNEPLFGETVEFGHRLPSEMAKGIEVVSNVDKMVLYRDGRRGFSVAILGEPTFSAPDAGVEAKAILKGVDVVVRITTLDAHDRSSRAAQVAALARDLTEAAPVALAPSPGVEAGATAIYQNGSKRRQVAVVAATPALGTHIAIAMIDYDADDIEPATLVLARNTIFGSMRFTAEPRRPVPSLPQSAWLEPGVPTRPRADRPSLSVPAAVTDEQRTALYEGLLTMASTLSPERQLDDNGRGMVQARLAPVLGDAAARDAASQVGTILDVIGLAQAVMVA